MSDEYWATFSIFDHRGPLYRNALILFDRVVMPVPLVPVGNLNQEEIDILSLDADYLVKENAAVRFDWDPNEFYAWRENTLDQASVASEALAKILVKDPPYATRLQLSEKYNAIARDLLPAEVDSVIAVPVYGSRERFETSTMNLYTAERTILEIVLKNLPTPAEDTPLENIVLLRNSAQFRESLNQLRRWQSRVVTQLLLKGDERTLRDAEAELKEWIRKYDEAMTGANITKIAKTVTSLIAIGAAFMPGPSPIIATLAKLASPLWTLKEIAKPCWKEIADKQYAPAGVIYAAAQLQ